MRATEQFSRLDRVAATLVLTGLVIPVAMGRWGSYLGVAGFLFLSDVLILSGLVHLIFARALVHRRYKLRLTNVTIVAILIAALGMRFESGRNLALVARDIVPFVYLALVPFVLLALQILGSDTVHRFVRNALLVHLIWYTPAAMGVLPQIQIPGLTGVPVFTTRGDLDGILTGAAVTFVVAYVRVGLTMKLLVACWGIAGLLVHGSRAGMGGALLIALVAIVFEKGWQKPNFISTLAKLAPITAVGVVVVYRLATDPPAWALGIAKVLPTADGASFQSGQNTWQARLDAWSLLLTWVARKPFGWLVGAGFGNDSVAASGALSHLSGDPSVRHPHNYLVTWYVATGLIGLGLALVLLFLMTAFIVKNMRNGTGNSVVGGLGLAIIVSGLAGVLLESPFGYHLVLLSVAAVAVASFENDRDSGALGMGQVSDADRLMGGVPR